MFTLSTYMFNIQKEEYKMVNKKVERVPVQNKHAARSSDIAIISLLQNKRWKWKRKFLSKLQIKRNNGPVMQ